MTDILRFFRHCSYDAGELTRVRQMLRSNGTSLILPYDQFIEHDCRHLEADSDAGNPDYILDLAIAGGYNAVAIHYGLARRFWARTEGAVPLLLKINGKTSFPSQAQAISSHTSWVEDAGRLGAVGVGYTMYYGSPRQDEDLPQLAEVRRRCEELGLPLVVWAYPRGEAIDAKGGRDSSYALESAARMAAEMGATIIKSNIPKPAPQGFEDNNDVPSYFRGIEAELRALGELEQAQERARRVVRAAQGVPVLFSGGSKKGDDDLMAHAKAAVDAGAFGFIFGRNMWKRARTHALEITEKVQGVLDSSRGPQEGFRGRA